MGEDKEKRPVLCLVRDSLDGEEDHNFGTGQEKTNWTEKRIWNHGLLKMQSKKMGERAG